MSLDNLYLVVTNNETIFVGQVSWFTNRTVIKNAFHYKGFPYTISELLNGDETNEKFLHKLPTSVVIDNNKIEFTCHINYDWPLLHLFEENK